MDEQSIIDIDHLEEEIERLIAACKPTTPQVHEGYNK